MRQLSESEQDALIKASQEYEPVYVGYKIEELQGFEGGFISGLDHAAEQVAALTAERDGLAMQVKDLEELRDYLRNALQDEAGIQKNMREANAYLARERKKAEAALKPFADLWRESLADKPDDTPTYGFNDVVITVGQIREARRVVEGSADEQKQAFRH